LDNHFRCASGQTDGFDCRYNSAVFSTITANNYAAAIVAENIYTESPPIHDANAKQWKDIIDESRVWHSLSPIDCVKAYNTPLQSRYGNLIVITYGENKTEGLVQSIQVHVSDNPTPQNWIGCPFSCSNETDSLKNITKTGEWTFHYAEIQPYRNTKTGEWTYGNVVQRTYTVKECRAERTPEVCKLQFSVGILSAVILCNAVKIVCMILAFANSSFVPLATIGDAIQSFLMVPDRSTLGRCYASKKFIDNDQRDDSPWNNGYFKPRARRRVRCRWWCAVSARRSAVSLLYMTGVVTGTACLLSLALDTTSGASFYDIWNLGLGQVNAGIVVTAFGKHMSLAFAVLLANSPQIILSFLYLLYNALFTNMLMGLEWNNYAQSRKTLRVTRPCGDQRGTYNLNLPYRYGVPLMIFSALLHWLASQSVFLVRIKTENRSFLQGSANQQHELISTAGLSAMALMFALLIGVLAVIAVLLSGCRVYPYDMAIAGSCSAAISAACHSIKMDEWEREQLVLKPLQWGDVGIVEVGVRHLSFSDEAVEAPRKFELYA